MQLIMARFLACPQMKIKDLSTCFEGKIIRLSWLNPL